MNYLEIFRDQDSQAQEPSDEGCYQDPFHAHGEQTTYKVDPQTLDINSHTELSHNDYYFQANVFE